MFARRRSSLSLKKLPCLNIALLTCCILAIGHVSPMSLDRLGRHYQQQNDKQLQLSEFMLPEAESEMLQSDMELVPDLDGNSDMYLLVPASATNEEQNLQSLKKFSDSQNTGNVESNSDMLMQESEDTPAVQILELPGNKLETKIGEELIGNNELEEDSKTTDNEISNTMINTIAEAAQEIENEIETELVGNDETAKKEESFEVENSKHVEEISSSNVLPAEHKDSETESIDSSVQEQVLEMENPEREMIGVVMEQSNEAPAANLESESSQETDKIKESLQLSLLGEDSEMQPNEQLIYQPQETVNNIEDTQSEGNSPAIELVQTIEEENKKTEADSVEDEINQELQIVKDNEHIKSGESPIPILIDEQKAETNEIKSEYQEVEQNQDVENTQAEAEAEETKTETVSADAFQDNASQGEISHAEEVHEGATQTDDEAQMALEKAETEKANDERQTSSAYAEVAEEVQPSKDILEEVEPVKAESLVIPQTISELQNAENFEPVTEIENISESFNAATAEETQSIYEIHSVESTTISTSSLSDHDSQIVNKFSQSDEEITPTAETIVSEGLQQEQVNEVELGNKNHQKEEIQAAEETQQSIDEQDDEEVKQVENIVPNNEQPAAVEDEAQFENNAPVIEDALNTQVTQNNEEPAKEIQPSEEAQTQDAEEAQSNEEVQHTQDIDIKGEEVSPAQNLQTAEEAQHYEETQSIEDVQAGEEAQPAEQIPFVEDAQVEFNIDSKPIEDLQTDDLIADAQHSAEGETLTEEKTQIQAAEPVETVVDDLEPAEEIQSSADESHIIDGNEHMLSSVEESKADENSQPFQQQPETPEFAVEQQEAEPAETRPVEISDDKIIAVEESNTYEEETAGQPIELAVENTLQNVLPVGDNQNENLHEATDETQKPLDHKDSDNINESEPIKETTSMLTTIVQVPAKEELTQQQVESAQEQQPAVVGTTLKPLNVLDGVLNYVNASFMNQMSNDNETEKVFSSKLRRYDGAQVWRIVVQNDRERKLADELQTKFDGQLWKEVKQEVDYLLKPQVLADAERHVKAANLSRIVLIENLQTVIEVENPPAEKIAQLQNRKGYRLTWEAYHRLEDIHGFFDYLAKVYPDICSVETIGYSIEKRPLKILKISNGNANNTGIWIDGGMHAREWISPAVVTYIANQIAEGWDELPVYMRNINWYVHAVANPDGYEYSHTTDRLWRKNMRSHGRACPGVDLNRNFGYKWGGKGTSANPCSQTYRGSKAFSEPETFYISKFISNFPRETFKAYLSFHSYGQYILYPWGYDYHITNDMADLDLVARKAGTVITKSTGAKFTVGSSATTLYPAAGGSDDWAKGIAGIKYSYTVEMGDTGRYGFILPAENIELNGKNGMTFVQSVAKAIIMGKNGRRRKLKNWS